MNNNKLFPTIPVMQDAPGKKIDYLKKEMDRINKESTKALRNIFKGEIKETFLIKVLDLVKKSHIDILDQYRTVLNSNFESYLQGTDINMDYDLCCHIVGIHKSNTLFCSEDEIGKLQKDNNYIKELCDKVYEHVKLRLFGSSFFRNKSLVIGDRFLYFTMGYDYFVASTYILFVLEEEKVKDNDLYNFYTSIASELISILTLIENGLLIQSYPQCRNLIELFFKYETLFHNPKIMDEYECFCKYEIDYAIYGKFDEEFKEKYQKAKEKTNVDIIDYLHYGWIDNSFEFNYLGKDKKYSIVGLYNYLKWKDNNKWFDLLKDLHNRCHMFSHGNTISKIYPIESYFEIMHIIHPIISIVLIDLCNIIEKEAVISNINIKKKIENDFGKFEAKSELLKMDNVIKYYKNKKLIL